MFLNHKVPTLIGFCKKTVLSISGATLLALASFFIVLPQAAQAATVYETAAANSEQHIDFPTVGSGATSTPNYFFAYRLPEGITYNKIQISVPPTQGSYSNGLSYGFGTWGIAPWGCLYTNCSINSFTALQSETLYNGTQIQVGTIQWNLSATTTTTNVNKDIYLIFDPNNPYTDFYYNGTPNQPQAAALNGNYYTRSFTVPTIKFCMNSCDNNDFSAMPNLTASPWIRVNSPTSGSTVLGGTSVPFTVEFNTGTSTATEAVLRFSSTLQSLIPYKHSVNQNGITTFSYNLNVPSFQDSISFNASLETPPSSQTYSANTRYMFSSAGGVPNVNVFITCTTIQTANCNNVLSSLPFNETLTLTSPDLYNSPYTFKITSTSTYNVGNGDQTIYITDHATQINQTTLLNTNTIFSRTIPTVVYAVSPTYNISVTTNPDSVYIAPAETVQNCDESTGIAWVLCHTFTFLFIPSDSSIDSFMTAYSELDTKIPFVYVDQTTDLITNLFVGTPDTFPTVSVTTGIGEITFISHAQLSAIPYISLLRSLIAAGLWIMLLVVVYRKTLTIHDKLTV